MTFPNLNKPSKFKHFKPLEDKKGKFTAVGLNGFIEQTVKTVLLDEKINDEFKLVRSKLLSDPIREDHDLEIFLGSYACPVYFSVIVDKVKHTHECSVTIPETHIITREQSFNTTIYEVRYPWVDEIKPRIQRLGNELLSYTYIDMFSTSFEHSQITMTSDKNIFNIFMGFVLVQ